MKARRDRKNSERIKSIELNNRNATDGVFMNSENTRLGYYGKCVISDQNKDVRKGSLVSAMRS